MGNWLWEHVEKVFQFKQMEDMQHTRVKYILCAIRNVSTGRHLEIPFLQQELSVSVSAVLETGQVSNHGGSRI